MPGRKRKAGDTAKDEESSAEKKAKPLGDKFGGLTEEEVCKLVLPDHMKPGLDIIFIGINPGLYSAYLGHHYCNANNHFWPCLYESGLIPRKLTYREDAELLDYGIGITNIVPRTTRSADKLSRKEMKEWSQVMIERMKGLKPLVACFNGKGIYEVFSGQKCVVGLQKDPLPGTDTVVYVMPSTSGRAATYPRRADKLKFFAELKALRDSIQLKNGLVPVEHGLGPVEHGLGPTEHGLGLRDHSSPATVALPQEKKESATSSETSKPQAVPAPSSTSSSSSTSSQHFAGDAQQHVPPLYSHHESSQYTRQPPLPQLSAQSSRTPSSTLSLAVTGPTPMQTPTVSSLPPSASSTSGEGLYPIPLVVPAPVVLQGPGREHHLLQYVHMPTARDSVGKDDRPSTL